MRLIYISKRVSKIRRIVKLLDWILYTTKTCTYKSKTSHIMTKDTKRTKLVTCSKLSISLWFRIACVMCKVYSYLVFEHCFENNLHLLIYIQQTSCNCHPKFCCSSRAISTWVYELFGYETWIPKTWFVVLSSPQFLYFCFISFLICTLNEMRSSVQCNEIN